MPRHFDDTPGGVPKDWINREEVMERTRWSPSKITLMVERGQLEMKVRDAKNYYDPKQVDMLLANPPPRKSASEKREEFAEYQLGVVRDIITLVKDPRERIDEIQFKIIDNLRGRVEQLEAKLDAAKEAIAAAEDKTQERALEMETVKSEARVKEVAMMRMVNTIGTLITGGKEGVKLTPDQLEQILIANADGEEKFLTPEQEKEAKVIVAQHKAKTNGKGVVAGVKKTVETATEAMKS